MTIIDALLGEHAVLYAQLDHVDATLPDVEDLAEGRAVAAVLTHAVLTHSRLEDEVLFTALERVPLRTEAVVKGMRRMHADLEEASARLSVADDLSSLREALGRLTALAREHFRAEEEVCFPLAEELLDPGLLQDLGRAWAERRGLSVGVP